MKWRNSKERELLSSGGSRESTLPNKGNPNPDLSDTKEDTARTPNLLDDLDDILAESPEPKSPSTSCPGSPQSHYDLINNNGSMNSCHSDSIMMSHDLHSDNDEDDEEIHVS